MKRTTEKGVRLRHYRDEFRLTAFWLEHQKNMEFLIVDYNQVVTDPKGEMRKVLDFLGISLDVKEMAANVDPALYRQRLER